MAAGRCLLAGAELQVVLSLLESEGCRGEKEVWVVRLAQVCSRLLSAQQPACPAHSAQLSTHSPLAPPAEERRATFPETRAICIRRRIGLDFLPASDNLARGDYVIVNASQWGRSHRGQFTVCSQAVNVYVPIWREVSHKWGGRGL